MSIEVRSLTIDIGQDVLDDLRERLRRTRWAPEVDNADGAWGLSGEVLRGLTDYWTEEYDWRATEAAMNRFENLVVELDAQPIHFLRRRGEGANPTPVLLTHGWPGSFWDFRELVPRLAEPSRFGGDPADSCDVIVPSLPGFDFSTPVPHAGISYAETADLWVRLMRDVLGYDRFFAHGYDWGGSVTAQLGHTYPEVLLGIHLSSPLKLGSWSVERVHAQLLGTILADCPESERPALLAWEAERASHLTVHTIEPQTLAWALNDSPVGQLAWLHQRRLQLSDRTLDPNPVLDPEDAVTLATLNWVTNSIGTSIRYYREATQHRWRPAHDRAPMVPVRTGLTIFEADLPPGFDPTPLKQFYDVVHYSTHPEGTGGHYPSLEATDLLADGIVETIRRATA